MKFRRLCIIGVGLIGGSLARALRRSGDCGEIVGVGRNADNLRRAVELGVIDRYETDPARGVEDADRVVLAVPLGAMEPVLNAIAPHLAPDVVVTDAGSAKAWVLEAVRAVFGSVPPFFVPGHPIAGTEKSGVEAALPELFEGRRVILTPEPETDPQAVQVVGEMWEACGARVTRMSAAHHDEVLAATSHLPHVLAFTLVDSLAAMGEREEIFQYAAGGFRDFTRIASSDPVMWRDICMANRDDLLALIERYLNDLGVVTDLINTGNWDGLLAVFQRAKAARDRFTDGTPG
ncbi:MAG TPA: prephenate dehydrogenase/arogenate dehydrogenase family protein [Gammaproteobacteria bacterium]|nr:prephenate dehydrogenase/arogenate dehydrogenase family protein [Gammaproteobacteria bacterium]